MSNDLSPTAPAGWYEDPAASGGKRYWTGSSWGPLQVDDPATAVEYPWRTTSAPAKSPLAVWSFVLGLVAVILFWVPLLYLLTSIAGGIVAIVLGRRARSAAVVNASLAKAGVVLGIIGVSLAGISGLLGAVLGVMRALS